MKFYQFSTLHSKGFYGGRYASATLANLAENFECHENIVEIEGLKLFAKIAGGAAVGK